MRTGGGGGGGQYDMVSASGDASLRLIAGGDVQPVNVDLIPAGRTSSPPSSRRRTTRSAASTTASRSSGARTRCCTTPRRSRRRRRTGRSSTARTTRARSPSRTTRSRSRTRPCTCPRRSRASGITDPYELNKDQFDATIDLLKQQKPLVKTYWNYAADEIQAFKQGDVDVGASWPYQTLQLQAAKVPVTEIIPQQGVTGWADTWMLAKKAPHPNCAYMWMKYVSHAAGPGAAGDRVRRDAGQPEGVPVS